MNLPSLASAWAIGTLILLLMTRHVLAHRLTDVQRRSFNVATVPLLGIFILYIVAEFLGGLQ